MQSAYEDFSYSSNKKVLIIVTDGDPFNPNLVLDYARTMKNNNIRIVTIGAGPGINQSLIERLSSPNDAYKIDNMSKLKETFETALLAILEI